MSRLIRAFPDGAEAQLQPAPPAVDAAAGREVVLGAFHNATAHPMGKATSLAVMLDQDECGEHELDPSVRENTAQLFEAIPGNYPISDSYDNRLRIGGGSTARIGPHDGPGAMRWSAWCQPGRKIR